MTWSHVPHSSKVERSLKLCTAKSSLWPIWWKYNTLYIIQKLTTMMKMIPSVTDRGASTINAVPMDLPSNLHRELANLTRPDQCNLKILYLCWFGKMPSCYPVEHWRGTEVVTVPTSGWNATPDEKANTLSTTHPSPLLGHLNHNDQRAPLGHHPPVKPILGSSSVPCLSWQIEVEACIHVAKL